MILRIINNQKSTKKLQLTFPKYCCPWQWRQAKLQLAHVAVKAKNQWSVKLKSYLCLALPLSGNSLKRRWLVLLTTTTERGKGMKHGCNILTNKLARILPPPEHHQSGLSVLLKSINLFLKKHCVCSFSTKIFCFCQLQAEVHVYCKVCVAALVVRCQFSCVISCLVDLNVVFLNLDSSTCQITMLCFKLYLLACTEAKAFLR